MRIVRHLRSAIGFLTLLPVGDTGPFSARSTPPLFPVAGLFIGLLVAGFDWIARSLFPVSAASLLDVILLAIITGGLHLDGLADTADGLYGNRPREKALAIMKDSRVGAMGLIAVWCALSIKWAGIAGIGPHRTLGLIVIPALSRGAMLAGFYFLPYGRPEGGTGAAFYETPFTRSVFVWLAAPALIALLAGWRGLWLLAAWAGATAAILLYYRRRMGCVTGDMLGAMCEATESTLFLMLSAGGGM